MSRSGADIADRRAAIEAALLDEWGSGSGFTKEEADAIRAACRGHGNVEFYASDRNDLKYKNVPRAELKRPGEFNEYKLYKFSRSKYVVILITRRGVDQAGDIDYEQVFNNFQNALGTYISKIDSDRIDYGDPIQIDWS